MSDLNDKLINVILSSKSKATLGESFRDAFLYKFHNKKEEAKINYIRNKTIKDGYSVIAKDANKLKKQLHGYPVKRGDKLTAVDRNIKTNVKAQMTEWKMWDEPGFNELVPIVLDISKQISQTKFKNRKINSKLDSMWGVKYKSEEITIAHDHWPAVWSFVYYLNAPKNAPGLFFTEMGEHGGEIKIEPGLLIFFEGHITHEVKSKKFEGHRYVVSGNIYD